MKNLVTKLLLTILFLGVLTILKTGSVQAAANFSLSPASKSVTQGATLAVQVRISSAETLYAIQANLTYPTDKLDFISISSSGSAFSLETQGTGGGGSVKISRAAIGGVTGDKLIATVNFRAKTGSGSATVSFAAGTEAADSNGNPVAGGQAGGTYTFAAAPVSPPPPPADTTAPQISAIVVSGISYKSVIVAWKTNESATSIVEYGINDKYGLMSQTQGSATDHSVALTSALLTPGTEFHFRVKSADAAGNEAISADGTFKTQGYTVKIKVVDGAGIPIDGAKVVLAFGPLTATTDKDGIATFTDAAIGKQLVTVEYNNQVSISTVEIKEATDEEIAAGTVKPQDFEVKVAAAAVSTKQVLNLVLIGLVLLLVGAVAYLIWRWKSKSKKPPTSSSGPTEVSPTPELASLSPSDYK